MGLNSWRFPYGPIITFSMTGLSYRLFFENALQVLPEDVPILLRGEMWFMYDGAPAHFSIHSREILIEEFTNR